MVLFGPPISILTVGEGLRKVHPMISQFSCCLLKHWVHEAVGDMLTKRHLERVPKLDKKYYVLVR